MDFSDLIYLLLELGIAGFLVWLIVTFIPMPEIFKKVIYGIAAIAVIIFCLHSFGFLGTGVTHRGFFVR